MARSTVFIVILGCALASPCGQSIAQGDADERGVDLTRDSDTSVDVSAESPCAITPAMIDRAISGIEKVKIKACVDRSAALDKFEFVPDPIIWLRFDVESDGSFTRAGIVEPLYRGSELEKCLSEAVLGARLEGAGCPGERTAKYPLILFSGQNTLKLMGHEEEDPGPPPDIDTENL